uniref:Uncharacterized protein n=1 Tax=viral metagenome TaxID=1070528 RepID=A0A6C0HTI1_9ZZZZ
MIEVVEIISYVFDEKFIVVQRKVKSNKNVWIHADCEIHSILRVHMIAMDTTPFSEQVKVNFPQARIVLELVCEYTSQIRPTILTKIYKKINYMLMLEKTCQEKFDNTFLKTAKEKLISFYLSQPYRTLELSSTLANEILTVESCLSPPFIPYIMGILKPPKWMVPRTVRTLNSARKIYQTREFVKKEEMILFLLLQKTLGLPSDVLKMISTYAVDLSKLTIVLFPIVSEKMLLDSEVCCISSLGRQTIITV